MSKKISAVGIKRLWYGYDNQELTAKQLSAYVDMAVVRYGMTELKNIHQDTWQLEEGEKSAETYKNQLTKQIYRANTKELGDLTLNWTIGQYDYALKKEFLGGEVIRQNNEIVGWRRTMGTPDIIKPIIVQTEDDQFAVFPRCCITANEANTDGAISIAVKGTVLTPEDTNVPSEAWFAVSESWSLPPLLISDAEKTGNITTGGIRCSGPAFNGNLTNKPLENFSAAEPFAIVPKPPTLPGNVNSQTLKYNGKIYTLHWTENNGYLIFAPNPLTNKCELVEIGGNVGITDYQSTVSVFAAADGLLAADARLVTNAGGDSGANHDFEHPTDTNNVTNE